MIVTGQLGLYGIVPQITMTRLADYADKGTTTLTVTDTSGWAVGSTIVITSTAESYFEDEYHVISAISGKTITISSPLVYDHYGSASRISSINGDLDMRATVGLLDRNIQIKSVGSYGSSVIIAGSRIKDPATKEVK